MEQILDNKHIFNHRNVVSQTSIDAKQNEVNRLQSLYGTYKSRYEAVHKAYRTWQKHMNQRLCKTGDYHPKFATWYNELQEAQEWKNLGNCMGKNEALSLRNYYSDIAASTLVQLNTQKKILSNYLTSRKDELDYTKDELDFEAEIAKLKALQSQVETTQQETKLFSAKASNALAKSNATKIFVYILIPIIIIAGIYFFIIKNKN